MRISDWSSDVCSSDLRPSPVLFFDCLAADRAPSGSAATPVRQRADATPAPECATESTGFRIAELVADLGQRQIALQQILAGSLEAQAFDQLLKVELHALQASLQGAFTEAERGGDRVQRPIG